ncbi:MAG: hypothetical protein IJS37_01460 [Bacilli bacterium]|nr:hypothetical protein [Bacilli bacterium]
MDKKTKFEWRPLLFLLIPLWTVIAMFIPGFRDGEYDLVAVEGGKPISAGQVGLFKAYLYSSDFVKIFFFLALISVGLIGIYAVFAAFFPVLRYRRVMVPTIMVLFVLLGVGYIAGAFLLANYVERFTIDYYASQKRIFDDYSALAFMNLNLLLTMAIPAVLFIWWIWTSIAVAVKKN